MTAPNRPRLSHAASRFVSAPPNKLSKALAERTHRGLPKPLNLAAGDPGECGLSLPPELVEDAYQRALADKGRRYDPHPLGRLELREAIACWHAVRGEEVAPDHIVIAPATSFGYFLLFRTLCDPGDEIIRPLPSYPLLDDIAAASGVILRDFHLSEMDAWGFGPETLEICLSGREKAISLVSPHNPTGAVLSRHQLANLGIVAGRHGLALIFDEVFSEFLYENSPAPVLPRPRADDGFPVFFLLNGLSKMFGMPGHKIGWIVVGGADKRRVQEALRALEHLSDAFLAASDIGQLAAARLIADAADGGPVLKATQEIAAKLTRRRQILLETLRPKLLLPGPADPVQDPLEEEKTTALIDAVPPAGGTYLTLRLLAPNLEEDDVVLGLLKERDLLIHPGYYYDLRPDHLVLTFLRPEEELRRAGREIAAFLAERAAEK
jgi:alanine-synthesizing transaminase